jgi:tRNA pseudouridine38-40 synthase
MRYLIHFSYDGTNFSGYQKQPNLRCVESELEKALFEINDHKVTKVVGAGRTDRGVHANCQCAHFDIDVDITLYKLKCALNSLLPPDVHVFKTEIVSDDFHARFNAVRKTYKYIINCGEYNPIERNYVYQYGKKLDVEKMKKEIKSFLGVHDFKPFVSEEALKEDYTREIFDAHIEEDHDKLIFYFTGTGFMKYQVRNMVGTLFKVGKGKLELGIVDKIFKDNSLSKYITTIKREGLYLENVEYDIKKCEK